MKKKKEETPIAPSFTAVGFIVTKAGAPCSIENISGRRKGGVLRAGVAPVAAFLKLRDARRAIKRTERCVAALRGSLVSEWAEKQAAWLFEPGDFAIVALGRQG